MNKVETKAKVVDTFVTGTVAIGGVGLIDIYTVPRAYTITKIKLSPCILFATGKTAYDYRDCSMKIVYNGTLTGTTLTGTTDEHILIPPCNVSDLDKRGIIELAEDMGIDQRGVISVYVDNDTGLTIYMMIRIIGELYPYPAKGY